MVFGRPLFFVEEIVPPRARDQTMAAIPPRWTHEAKWMGKDLMVLKSEREEPGDGMSYVLLEYIKT